MHGRPEGDPARHHGTILRADSITVEERFFRGGWSTPKTSASAATIGVSPEVIAHILALKPPRRSRFGRGVRSGHTNWLSRRSRPIWFFRAFGKASRRTTKTFCEDTSNQRPTSWAACELAMPASVTRNMVGSSRSRSANRCKVKCGTRAFRPRSRFTRKSYLGRYSTGKDELTGHTVLPFTCDHAALRPIVPVSNSVSPSGLLPRRVFHMAGRSHAQGCSQPRSFPRSCVRSPTYVAQRFMWRSLLGGPEGAPSRADKRQITWPGGAGE
jgi:hypothetical protein